MEASDELRTGPKSQEATLDLDFIADRERGHGWNGCNGQLSLSIKLCLVCLQERNEKDGNPNRK